MSSHMANPEKQSKATSSRSKPAAPHGSGTHQSSGHPARSRRWIFRLAAMVCIPLLFLGVLEITLRIAGYGYDPGFFRRLQIGDEDFFIQNEDFSRRFFPPETLRHPGALRMRAEKAEGTVRIFILGESAAMGDPEPTYGPSRYLEAILWQRRPEIDFEVVNVSFTAINSHVILPIARECARREGDIWIIYMGNNEMVGPYGAVTVFGVQAPPLALVRLSLALQRTRIGQLGLSIVRDLQKSHTDSASWDGMEMFLKQRVAPVARKREVVYRNFEANLEAMVERGLDAGAAVILNTVAVNLRDSPPFASMADEGLSDADRVRFNALFNAGKEEQNGGDPEQAAALFGQASELDPGLAEAHYRLAMSLETMDRQAEALREYQRACDRDALPFRADSRINESIRATAVRHAANQLVLLDTPDRLADEESPGLCGGESFYEHVHFNFDGGYRLGRVWAQAVEALLPETRPASPTNTWPSQPSCERRLGLTDWNRKLIFRSVLTRFQQPPLSRQFNNADRIRRLNTDQEALLSGVNKAMITRAHRTYDQAISSRPDDHFLHEAYAGFLQSLGDLPGATREWRVVSELLPHDFLPWFQIGSLLLKQGNHAEGRQSLRKALALRPTLIVGWTELGQSLGASGDWDSAVEAFERASLLRPSDPVLWAYQAKALAGAAREEEAIESYRRAVEIRPRYGEAHGALGDLLSAADRSAEAIPHYEAAIRANPDNVTVHFNLGVMLVRGGRLEEGARQFERTLELDPEKQVARDYLSRVERLLKEQGASVGTP